MADETPLYDPEILKKHAAQLGDRYAMLLDDESLCVRPLYASDYNRGFLELLKELTDVVMVPQEQFQKQFELMKSCPDTYYCTVIVDTVQDRIVAAATLLMERKFIRGLALRARLEDVVVNSNYRGKQLGKSVVEIVTNLGKALGAYKMTLDCRDAMMPFYQTLGYVKESGGGNMMSVRFPPASSAEAKL